MSGMRTAILGGAYRTGGSVSRLPATVYREAAALAYHFGWGRRELFGMTGKERAVWLRELDLRLQEQRAAREAETLEQARKIFSEREKEDSQ